MPGKTNIEWATDTWNFMTGCNRVSPGCDNCYAKRDWSRLAGNPLSVYYGREFEDVEVHPERLGITERWKKSRRIFVVSMGDPFHHKVPDEFLHKVFDEMERSPQHDYLITTKREERMAEFIEERFGNKACPDHIWLGVSIENQPTAEMRLYTLARIKAAVRWVSLEPQLDFVDLSAYLAFLNWVVVGGESGPGARPFDIAWARSVLEECRASNVPVFIKQLGKRPTMKAGDWDRLALEVGTVPLISPKGRDLERSAGLVQLAMIDNKAGQMSEWPEDLRVREFPATSLRDWNKIEAEKEAANK